MNAKENSLLKQIGQQIKKLAKAMDEGEGGGVEEVFFEMNNLSITITEEQILKLNAAAKSQARIKFYIIQNGICKPAVVGFMGGPTFRFYLGYFDMRPFPSIEKIDFVGFTEITSAGTYPMIVRAFSLSEL